MKEFLRLTLILLFCFRYDVATANLGETLMKRDPLIEREVLFDNPDKTVVKLSPNGKYISFIAPKDGVLNIWIAPANDITKAKAITQDKTRGIRSYFWSKNNNAIIYPLDKNGDENWCLYSVNINNLEQKSLTPFEGSRASVLKLSEKYPEEALILINNRVAEYYDIYRINIETGKRELLYENKDNWASFVADEDFAIRLAYKMLPSGEGEIYYFAEKDINQPQLLKRISREDMITTYPSHITEDGNYLYMVDSEKSNTSSLLKINLNNRVSETIYNDPKADIEGLLINPKTKSVEAVATEYTRISWKILDDKVADDIKFLKELDTGDIDVISRTSSDDKWVIAFSQDIGPNKYYLYDRVGKKAIFLFVSNARLQGLSLAHMYPLKIKARDGLELVCYLTVPRWLDNGKGFPLRPVPMVLYVHGGPNARDEWGFSSTHQWLANRGYAVLSINYRGSTGFGKAFTNSGDGQWAKAMQDDLEDAVKWAIDNNIAVKDKIAIMGGSYGGYATLVGLTRTPDLFAAGIDIVGPSNLVTLLKSIPPYWKPLKAHLTKIIGASEDTEEGREFLKERSPITYAVNIKKPLLIVQGANDPRVKQAESDQIVAALQEAKIPVVYLLYSDEGHGLNRPENRLSMYAHAEIFLANFLGGDYLPHGNDFPNSTIEVKAGKEITWTKQVKSH